MKLLLAVLLAMSLGACSGGPPNGDKVDGFNHQTLLTLVGFTGSVVKVEKRFAGYTKSAKRVSLIDPGGEREVWGAELDGDFDSATALPDFSGVALFSGGVLQLVGPGGTRAFPAVPFPIGYLGRSRAAAAYAAVSADGQKVHVTRALAGGGFEDETLTSPWEDEGTWASPPDKQPPLGVALFSADGNRLVYVRPADGRYALYEAADAASPLKLVLASLCNGDGSGTPDNATYRSLAYDDGLGVVYAGDRDGRLSVFNPKAPCIPPADRAALTLGAGEPITDINVFGAGKPAVTQAGAKLHLVAFDGTAFQAPDTYSGICPYPLGALPAGEDRLAVVCFTPTDFDAEKESRQAPAVLTYDGAEVVVVSAATRQPVLTLPLDVETAAGMAVDGEQGRLLTLKDSALGVLEATSLVDGSVQTKKGLFLSGILN